MPFVNFRIYSVKIGNSKSFGRLPENAGCIPPAVVIIMTTADGMYPAFSGRRPKLFFKYPIYTDLYRHLTEIAEVHYTPGYVKCLERLLVINIHAQRGCRFGTTSYTKFWLGL